MQSFRGNKMANNYCLSSSWMDIHQNKIKKARDIVDRVVKQLEEGDEEYCGVVVKVESGGVWFSHDESINLDHVEIIAKALIEELKINKPFFCSWAYTCSKARIDEFGGGAFVVMRGKDTYWVDAVHLVSEHAKM